LGEVVNASTRAPCTPALIKIDFTPIGVLPGKDHRVTELGLGMTSITELGASKYILEIIKSPHGP
jgi:hypothetical protein